jgi:uncharacterized membrane protein HdeD (DUF308 family)
MLIFAAGLIFDITLLMLGIFMLLSGIALIVIELKKRGLKNRGRLSEKK